MGITHQLHWYDTNNDTKYTDSDKIFKIYGDANSTWRMWYELVRVKKCKYVEVYTLMGLKCKPESGINSMYYD